MVVYQIAVLYDDMLCRGIGSDVPVPTQHA